MSDTVSPEQRRINMQKIRSKDTSIEIQVRKYLFSKGFRYRKNVSTLPGKPDLVLRKYNTVIFVNGCFWHMHQGCRKSRIPRSNTEYWEKKLKRNAENDRKNIAELTTAGWSVIVLWECDLKRDFDGVMQQTIKMIFSGNK